MIPTVSKDKLPAFLIYPVNAKTVTDALSAVPQIDSLELWFTANRYRKPPAQEKHPVCSVRYRRHNMGLSAARWLEESGFYRPKWDVRVYAVPRQQKAFIRAAMIDHGFDIIQDWLTQPRTELWLTTSHECQLWYSAADERLVTTSENS